MKIAIGLALTVVIVGSSVLADRCASLGQARREQARREADRQLQVARDRAVEAIRVADEQDRAKAAMIHQVVDNARQALIPAGGPYDVAPTSVGGPDPSDQTRH